MLVLHQGDGLQATGHGDVDLVAHDALGGQGDAHQARGALALHRHAGHAGRQAGGHRAEAAEVVGLGALLGRGAHDHVIHLARLDAGTAHGLTHHMATQQGRLGVVEGTAEGLADGGTGGGYDYGFVHLVVLEFIAPKGTVVGANSFAKQAAGLPGNPRGRFAPLFANEFAPTGKAEIRAAQAG
ncbi:hypothetical protein FQZ97_1010140 [compost metagenome]